MDAEVEMVSLETAQAEEEMEGEGQTVKGGQGPRLPWFLRPH